MNAPLRRSPRLRFLTADTGGGHRASAEALAASVTRLRPDATVEIIDLCANGGGLASLLPRWYAWVATRPHVWSVMFHALDGRRRRHLIWAPFYLTQPGVYRRMVEHGNPDAVVVVHPGFTTGSSLVASKLDAPPAICTVVTDPVSGHASWYESRVDLMVVSTPAAAARARQFGINESRLQIVDHPVHPRVPGLCQTRRALREAYGWNDMPVVLCTGGGETSGRLYDVVIALRGGTRAHIVVVCGRNEALRRALEALSDVEVLGFVPDLPERMAAADVVVSKAGPSTLAEAGAVGTPVVVYEHMPGQEAGNLAWVVQRGWGQVAHAADDIGETVRELLADVEGRRALRERAQAAAGEPSASDLIAAALLERAQEVCDARAS